MNFMIMKWYAYLKSKIMKGVPAVKKTDDPVVSGIAYPSEKARNKEMAQFYIMLSKMKKRRPGFNVKRVMEEVYPLKGDRDLLNEVYIRCDPQFIPENLKEATMSSDNE